MSFPKLLVVGALGAMLWGACDPGVLLSDVLYAAVPYVAVFYWAPMWPKAAAKHSGINWVMHWFNGAVFAVGTLVFLAYWAAGELPAFGTRDELRAAAGAP